MHNDDFFKNAKDFGAGASMGVVIGFILRSFACLLPIAVVIGALLAAKHHWFR